MVGTHGGILLAGLIVQHPAQPGASTGAMGLKSALRFSLLNECPLRFLSNRGGGFPTEQKYNILFFRALPVC